MDHFRLLLTLLVALTLVFSLATRVEARPSARAAFPVTLVDDLHNTVKLTHRPLRIISLDPRDTETLFAVGAENRVVGDSPEEGAHLNLTDRTTNFRYPVDWPSRFGRDYPTRSKRLAHIPGGFGSTPFDLEKIESLNPDLIFTLNSDLPTIQKMRDLGLKVIVLDPASVKGILRDIDLVGKATGNAPQAKTVVSTIRAEIQRVVKRLARARKRPRVYYEIDATNPAEPYTAGPGTFIDEAIRLSGGKNLASGVRSCSGTTCYPAFSLESLVKLNPQIIVLGDAVYGTTVQSVKDRAGWSSIAAIRAGKIYPFDDDLISRAGPRIGIGIQQLARKIHPEIRA